MQQRKGGGSHPLTLNAIVMNLMQLFKLEACLNGYSANFYHTEIEYETRFSVVFQESKTVGLNELQLKGSFIVIFAEDKVEQNYIMDSILHSVPDIKYAALIITDENIGGDYRIIIKVEEYK